MRKIIRATLLISIFISLTLYAEAGEAKRRAPIYLNRNGSGETIQYLDGVKVIQTPNQQFNHAQLNQIVSVLDKTPSNVLSKISYIQAVTNKPWGGETLSNNRISINANGQGQRTFQEVAVHEIGHAAFCSLPVADKDRFIVLHNQSMQPSDFATSDYPIVKTRYIEDFCDTYMKAVLAPQSLNSGSAVLNAKVNIIKNNLLNKK